MDVSVCPTAGSSVSSFVVFVFLLPSFSGADDDGDDDGDCFVVPSSSSAFFPFFDPCSGALSSAGVFKANRFLKVAIDGNPVPAR